MSDVEEKNVPDNAKTKRLELELETLKALFEKMEARMTEMANAPARPTTARERARMAAEDRKLTKAKPSPRKQNKEMIPKASSPRVKIAKDKAAMQARRDYLVKKKKSNFVFHATLKSFNVCGKKVAYNSDLFDQFDLQALKKATPSHIQLSHVYGYNGGIAHDNIKYCSTGEVIYHVAGVCVVANPNTKHQRFYRDHTDDIFCLAVSPCGTLIASGQKDPRGKADEPFVKIWNPVTMVTEHTFYFHERGINLVAFTPDGKHILTMGGDDNHLTALFSLIKVKGKTQTAPVCEGRLGKDLFWTMNFDPTSVDLPEEEDKHCYRLVASCDGSYPAFYTITGPKDMSEDWEFKAIGSNPFKRASNELIVDAKYPCAMFTTEGVAVAGGESGTVYFTDPDLIAVVATIKPSKSKNATAVTAVAEYKETASGGRLIYAADGDGLCSFIEMSFFDSNGNLGINTEIVNQLELEPSVVAMDCMRDTLVWGTEASFGKADLNTKLSNTIFSIHTGEVWGMATSPLTHHICSVGTERRLAIHDAELGQAVYELDFSEFSKKHRLYSLAWNHKGDRIAIGTSHSLVYILSVDEHYEDVHLLHKVVLTQKTQQTVSVLKFSPCDKYVACGSSDQKVYLVDPLKGSVVRPVMRGHSTAVLSVTWSDCSGYLMSCDQSVSTLHWKVPANQICTQMPPNTKWHKFSSLYHPYTKGIWKIPGLSDRSDVNAVAVSNSAPGKFPSIAIGDDNSLLWTGIFPALDERKCTLTVQTGHSTHVAALAWTHDESSKYLFSGGGDDRSIMQWRHGPTKVIKAEIEAAAHANLGALGLFEEEFAKIKAAAKPKAESDYKVTRKTTTNADADE